MCWIKVKKSKTMTISGALVENDMQDIWLSMSQEGIESQDSNAVQCRTSSCKSM